MIMRARQRGLSSRLAGNRPTPAAPVGGREPCPIPSEVGGGMRFATLLPPGLRGARPMVVPGVKAIALIVGAPAKWPSLRISQLPGMGIAGAGQ